MKYTAPILSTLVAVAVAKPAFLNTDFNVVEGQPFTLKFSGCEAGCTILLENGPGDDLKPVEQLTGSATGSSYTFTLSNIPSDTYAFTIMDNATGEENYSAQFEFVGTGAPPTTAMTVTSTTEAPETTTTVKPTTTESMTTASSTEESTTMTMVNSSTEISSTTETSTMNSMTMNSTTMASTTMVSTTMTSTTTENESTSTSATPTTAPTTVPDSGAGQLASTLTLISAAVAAILLFN